MYSLRLQSLIEDMDNDAYRIPYMIFSVILMVSFFGLLIGSIYRLFSVFWFERNQTEDELPDSSDFCTGHESFINRVMVKQQYQILLFFFLGLISLGTQHKIN